MQTSIESQHLSDTEKRMYSRDEVAQHTQDGDVWVIIERDVYDLSQFLQDHPGGSKILLGVAGQDATKKFKKYHRMGILSKYNERLLIGRLEESTRRSGSSLRSSIFAVFRRSET
ncbi:acyl-CoA dehydrogenase [Penicillium cataractarum]|uniref:Acyl-CoA dehydrogenase n=1 Tax=Penicillium cataractarum TaxID=2100454 RepID=A0A9W9R8G1_9EURO|nr:acyl-CoA dehydrogenase [Penicillium cataractarum]KAJ5355536.1 acyl-CoA dehydrogenase [Penicillium cataractarum]